MSIAPGFSLGLVVLLFAVYRVMRIGSRPRGLPPGPNTLPVLGNIHLFPRRYVYRQYDSSPAQMLFFLTRVTGLLHGRGSTEESTRYISILSFDLVLTVTDLVTDHGCIPACDSHNESPYLSRPDGQEECELVCSHTELHGRSRCRWETYGSQQL